LKLLITNTREDQAYMILRCLRGETDRIVATICGDSWIQRWAGMTQWSRYVNKRYRVPDCSVDWKTGRIQPGNTEREERFMQRIEEICEAEEIDVIYPSYDAEVYVFSKNKTRLADRGVTAVVPDYAALTGILDKSLTIKAAIKAGFPVPETRLPGNTEELAKAAGEIPAPWILKPRCAAHMKNIRFVETPDALESAFNEVCEAQDRPLLQEFIPLQTKRNFYMLVSPDSGIVSVFSPFVQRVRKAGLVVPCAAVITTRDIPYLDQVGALVRELGVWGAMTLQTVVDKRDGKPKLMEINPRFGTNLWFRTALGINEPLMFLRLARGESPGEYPNYPEGVLLADPFWDLMHLVGQLIDQSVSWIRSRFRRKDDSQDGDDGAVSSIERESIPELLRHFKADYFSRRDRIICPLTRGYLTDPLPGLARFVKSLAEMTRRRVA